MSVTRYKWEQWNTASEKKLIEKMEIAGAAVVVNSYDNNTNIPSELYRLDRSYINWYYYPATGNEIIAHIDTDGDWLSLKSTSGHKDVYTAYDDGARPIPDGNYFWACYNDRNHINNKFAIMGYAPKGAIVKMDKYPYGDGNYYVARVSTDCLTYSIGMATIKGDTKQKEYVSSDSSKFPENGYYNAGGIIGWFVLVGSDSITPASVTFPSRFHVGSIVKVTINPSANLSLGGTITYTTETTEDGTNWTERQKGTGTEATFYVPETATKWGVRVKASDDNGIVDDTYVYGNGVTTVTPETSDFLPYSGNIGYAISKHVLDAIIASASSFSLTATINGATVYSGTGVNGTNAITISDNVFAGLPENEPIEMTVKAELSSGTVMRFYTFRKFDYDHTSLSGVFTGTAKALRNQTGDSAPILGADIPEKIMKLPAYKLPDTTATPDTVFAGKTFIDQTGEIRAGRGLAKVTTATADSIGRGLTAYNYLGELMTGTGSSLYVQAGSLQPTLQNKTYTIPYDAAVSGETPSCILAYFNTWVGSDAAAGRHPSFSPYFFRGAASGQLYGLTPAAGGTMLNQNQTAANTTITVGTTSFSVTISKHDYVTGCEFCYILVW